MAYTPPVGTVNLSIGSVHGYDLPVGDADLHIGHLDTDDRNVVLSGTTAAPTGAVLALKGKLAVISGTTAAPTGLFSGYKLKSAILAGTTNAPTGEILAVKQVVAAIAGTTAAPTGRIEGLFEENLLSAVHAVVGTRWQHGDLHLNGIKHVSQEATPIQLAGPGSWQDAISTPSPTVERWQSAAWQSAVGIDAWQEAESIHAGKVGLWADAIRFDGCTADRWQDAELRVSSDLARFADALFFGFSQSDTWQHGDTITRHVRDGMRDGLRLMAVEVEVWQQAGYPSNAVNPQKDQPPPIIPWPWGTNLHLRCPLPGTHLRIGRSPCILVAEREIPYRKTYMSTNSASLVRWPDLTPLPVIAMSVETDFDSWCWGLSATLAGPAAWPLVQPNPLACEVQATINGQVWRFLLDVPSTNRSFNSDRVTLKGRSRAAWLHDPYTPSSDRSESEAREMQQLGEAALYNTGWTLDWQTSNWVVPAGRYNSWNTPMGALIRLMNASDDGLYTHPYLQVISALKRWPAASWLVDGETVDLLIPESATISLTQSPVYSQPLNGVYVSGTSHGALALVKIAGTDGALQPADPIVEELLCDEAGVAARARGLNALSDSGAGWEMDAEVLFTEEVGLVRPGMIVSIAGVKGISRSCRIQCTWNEGGLVVRQSVGLERREVEA